MKTRLSTEKESTTANYESSKYVTCKFEDDSEAPLQRNLYKSKKETLSQIWLFTPKSVTCKFEHNSDAPLQTNLYKSKKDRLSIQTAFPMLLWQAFSAFGPSKYCCGCSSVNPCCSGHSSGDPFYAQSTFIGVQLARRGR